MKIFVKLFAALNLGDDLFLKILLERYPDTEFVISAPEIYKTVFNRYENLHVMEDKNSSRKTVSFKLKSYIERNVFPSLYSKRLKLRADKLCQDVGQHFDAFLSIGGSIFMQPRKLPHYPDVIYYGTAKSYYKNIFFIGCNFGPFNDLKYKDDFRDIFRQANDVCFREKYSWELFSDLTNVRYKPDVVFGLDCPNIEKRSKTVGFSIITARNGVNEQSYIKKYADLISFYQKKNYEIFLFSFCKKQGDEDIIESVVDYLDDDLGVNKVFYDGDIEKFLKVYGSIEKMFCGRFHSMILSILFGQEIYPVIYSKKMTNVLSDIDYKGKVIYMDKFSQLKTAEIYNQIGRNKYDIKDLRKTSGEQFEQLDLFINQDSK